MNTHSVDSIYSARRLGMLCVVTLAGLALPTTSVAGSRQTISLDGTWQVAEGKMDQVPTDFKGLAPVPGLVDMAQPRFQRVGQFEPRRQAFWYRRAFIVEGSIPSVARLKLNKAMFGTRVWLNGKLVGDHLPCFTPAFFDVHDQLKGHGQANELLIRVGSSREAVPRSIPSGGDFEKVRYIPGIYDSVALILSGSPSIERVQAVPDLAKKAVRVVSVLGNVGSPVDSRVNYRVRQWSDGKIVGIAKSAAVHVEKGQQPTVEVTIPIAQCRFWSPEDPFLYQVEVDTGADTLVVRIGMRTIGFDSKTKRALLNGKPYALRGTNVCIYRFFEDPARSDLPWRDEWVRRLHKTFRDMHWNSARYCIGFPPERWYEIADEEGLMIQDEFPIWGIGEVKSPELIQEFTEWMRERWNHPSVIIWDAQNETSTAETATAINAVRGLDLSNRPWDNGWGLPQSPTDVFEAHPYAFISMGKPSTFRLSQFARLPGTPGVPGGIGAGGLAHNGVNPIIINEYGWLWLTRDGQPTTLTRQNYEVLLGPQATVEQRRHLYARYLAAKTEFWRSRRQVAGVMHFCGLGYSRADGQTSDNFLNVEKLTWEPEFRKYVRDAFAPVGLMIDFWAERFPNGEKLMIPVVVINDRAVAWEGPVRLRVLRGEQAVTEQSQPCRVDVAGTTTLRFEIHPPKESGDYHLVADLAAPGQQTVESWRDAAVPPARK